MIEVGRKNTLRIVKKVDFGIYLDGLDLGEILLPTRYVPEEYKIDEELEVFIYLDSEDRVIATTEDPYAEVGRSAHLQVVATSNFGAFMDWGLMKDLLVPFKEQRVPMQKGKSYTVYLFLDVTGRINASSKLSRFLKENDTESKFVEGQMVSLQICSRSELGYRAIIDETHLGLIHNVDILQAINVGEAMNGYIKQVRDDGKIDLVLQAKGKKARQSLADDVLEFITSEGGRSDLTDKSPPEDIYKIFRVSKTNYKKALGKLYKEKLIIIEKDSVSLVKKS